MTETPAYIRNARMDILAANKLCFALYAGVLTPETLPMNLARFIVPRPARAEEVYLDWDSGCGRPTVAALRIRGRASNPHDRKAQQTSSASSQLAATPFGHAGHGTTSRHHRTSAENRSR